MDNSNTKRFYSVEELVAWTPPFQPFIMDKLIVPQGRVFVFGQSETWKSTLTIHLSFCLATGKPFFGFKTSPTPCATLQTENPMAQERDRVIKYMLGNGITSDKVWFWSERYIKLDKGWGYNALCEELAKLKPRALVIDPCYMVMSGRITDVYDVMQFLDKIDVICSDHKVAVIIVHHTRKTQMVDGIQVKQDINDLFGASQFRDWCDTAIMLSNTDIEDTISMEFQKHRHSDINLKPITIKINRLNYQFTLVDNPNTKNMNLNGA